MITKEQFTIGIYDNNISIIKYFLIKKDNNPAFNHCWVMTYCAENGYSTILELFLNDSRFKLFEAFNQSFFLAVANGHIDTVLLLIDNDNVDITERNNLAIRTSFGNGNKELTKILWNNKIINESLSMTNKQLFYMFSNYYLKSKLEGF
jgi:hypothetical protein